MGKSAEYRTSAPQWDGELPLVINSPVMSFSSTAAVTQQGAFVAPCDLTIVKALIAVPVAPLTTVAYVNIGTRADDDEFLDAYALTTLTGLRDLAMTTAVFNGVSGMNIDAGDIVEFGLAQGGGGAGKAAVSLVCMPRSSQ